jgi:adenylate cyclase class 2
VKPHATKPPIEVEIKLAVPSAAKARALLRRLDFKITAPRIFERNLVLDDGQGSLRARGILLRVREAGKTSTCTFKGPDLPGRHKRRVEREFTASDAESCLAVFAGVGFRESFRYEKYRTEFARPYDSGIATLDETPIGVFMELEGPARWIDTTAQTLGFTRDAYITASYARLYFAWCEAYGIEPTGMCFPRAS